MKKHFLYECEIEPRLQCTQCDYRTHWKQSLQKHLIQNHEIDPSQLAVLGAGKIISYTLLLKIVKIDLYNMSPNFCVFSLLFYGSKKARSTRGLSNMLFAVTEVRTRGI